MATLNFPDEPTTGDIYNDSNSGFSYEWNGTVWISTDPQRAANIREIDNISSGFDGSDTTFTLQVAGVNVEPANAQQLIISVGGVMQNAGDDFTVSGSTLTFTTAPDSGLTFFGVLLGQSLSLNTVADGSVGSASLKTEDFTIGGSSNTVTIPGNLTVQGTETIINVDELNIQDKTIGIASTNAPTATTQDGAGAIIYGETHIDILYDVDKAALGISTAVNVSGFVTATSVNATSAVVGSAVTINNTGIDGGIGVGIVTAGTLTAKGGAAAVNVINSDGSNSATFKRTSAGETRIENSAADNFAIRANSAELIKIFGATGTVTGTAATIGTGVTVNNTGIDAGNAGIVTAGTLAAPSAMAFQAGGSERVRISSAGNLGVGDNSPDVRLHVTETIDVGYTLANVVTEANNLVKIENPSTTANAFSGMQLRTGNGADMFVGLIQQSGNAGDLYVVNQNSPNKELVRIKSTGNVGIGTDNPQRKLEVWGATESNIRIEGGADYYELRVKDSDNAFTIHKNIAGAGSAEVLAIDANAGFKFSNGLFDEKVNITAGKLSDNQDIDLADGMVHYFTTQESTTALPNIRINSSTTLQTAMDTGDVCTVTLITTAAAAGYSANLTIDSTAVTEEWVGGSAPSAGNSDGLDIYTYTIICIGTGTGDSGFKVIANLTNATN